MKFSYGNSRHELEFDVQVRETLLETLKDLGFLDDEFDVDAYFDCEDDVDLDREVMDAVIDYYDDRAESRLEIECDKMNQGEDYDEDFVNADDIDRIYEMATLHPFRVLQTGVELVTVRETVDTRGNN